MKFKKGDKVRITGYIQFGTVLDGPGWCTHDFALGEVVTIAEYHADKISKPYGAKNDAGKLWYVEDGEIEAIGESMEDRIDVLEEGFDTLLEMIGGQGESIQVTLAALKLLTVLTDSFGKRIVELEKN